MNGPEKLVIDRKKWLRGEGGSKSYLHRERDGKMCCLGLYLQECGVTVKQMGFSSAPANLINKVLPAETVDLIPDWLVDKSPTRAGNSRTAILMMEVNDNDDINESQRERDISRFFREFAGCEVTFK